MSCEPFVIISSSSGLAIDKGCPPDITGNFENTTLSSLDLARIRHYNSFQGTSSGQEFNGNTWSGWFFNVCQSNQGFFNILGFDNIQDYPIGPIYQLSGGYGWAANGSVLGEVRSGLYDGQNVKYINLSGGIDLVRPFGTYDWEGLRIGILGSDPTGFLGFSMGVCEGGTGKGVSSPFTSYIGRSVSQGEVNFQNGTSPYYSYGIRPFEKAGTTGIGGAQNSINGFPASGIPRKWYIYIDIFKNPTEYRDNLHYVYQASGSDFTYEDLQDGLSQPGTINKFLGIYESTQTVLGRSIGSLARTGLSHICITGNFNLFAYGVSRINNYQKYPGFA